VKRPDKNSFFYPVMQVLRKQTPHLIHDCPFKNEEFQIKNLELFAGDIALWIQGEYKVIYSFYNENDEMFFKGVAKGVLKRQ
jgi:hypothetical protein